MSDTRFTPQQHEELRRSIVMAISDGEELMFYVAGTAPVWLTWDNVAPVMQAANFDTSAFVRVENGRLQVWAGVYGFLPVLDASVERFWNKYRVEA